jgi:putative MATE family efflux protein
LSRAVFTRGSLLRHVLLMTGAGSASLIAMFGAELVDMYFLSLIGELELVAAVGYASTLSFFLVSVSIGLQIALGAMVARAEGGDSREQAGRVCAAALWFNGGAAVAMAAVTWSFLEPLLALLGANGTTLEMAVRYARISLVGLPVMVLAWSAVTALRALGDARRGMWSNLLGSLANVILDPIFIFYFGWGLEGAAAASVLSRIVVFLVAWRAMLFVHCLPRRIDLACFRAEVPRLLHIAVPAILTNLATPLGNSIVLRIMSQFGDSAVAGIAILGRVSPLAYAAVFALSGAIGPIIAQNAGAGRYDRVQGTIIAAAGFNAAYIAVVWLLLFLSADLLVSAFSASAEAAALIRFYCTFLVGAWFFNGMLFAANAAFNNLHAAHLATLFNFAKVLLGIVPGAWLGAAWFGAHGVIAGEAIGMVLFGALGLVAILLWIGRLARAERPPWQEAPAA